MMLWYIREGYAVGPLLCYDNDDNSEDATGMGIHLWDVGSAAAAEPYVSIDSYHAVFRYG